MYAYVTVLSVDRFYPLSRCVSFSLSLSPSTPSSLSFFQFILPGREGGKQNGLWKVHMAVEKKN